MRTTDFEHCELPLSTVDHSRWAILARGQSCSIVVSAPPGPYAPAGVMQVCWSGGNYTITQQTINLNKRADILAWRDYLTLCTTD